MERAVFYARVSTEEEEQVNALDSQIQQDREVIASKGWELVDEYIDEGKSGTKIKGRNEYQRLLVDMGKDRFDVIVIKDQDRLMRNTRDWYNFLDVMVNNKIKLFMILDNKFYHTDDALITGIKAIMAEEYSRNLSKKLNNSNQRRIEKAKKGEPVSAMGNGQTYGYRIVDKNWVIDPEEAEIVCKIYKLYLELHSLRKVRNTMNEQGYRNKKGKLFTEEVIGRVIKNEMHKGWVILNRYHRNFETKEIEMLPEEEWVIVKDDHEPIVSDEIWDKVNNEIQSHRNKGNNKGRGRKVGDDVLSGKMFCASCGKVLWKHQANGYTNWYCSGKMGRGSLACDKPVTLSGVQIKKYLVTIADEFLDYSTIEYSKTLLKHRTIKWLEDLRAKLTIPNDNSKIEAELKKLERKKAKLLDAYTDDLISKEEFKEKREEWDKLILDKKALLVVEENGEDIRAIDVTIRNIDNEIELMFANEAMLEENKIKFLMEHTKKIIVFENRDVCVILDKVAGAFLFVDGGEARIDILSAEGDNLPFDRESMQISHGGVCYEGYDRKGALRQSLLCSISSHKYGRDRESGTPWDKRKA